MSAYSSNKSPDFHYDSHPKTEGITSNHPAHPDFKRKSSFMHSFLTKISHIEPTTNSGDPEYDYAKANYDKFATMLTRLKTHLQQYQHNVKGLLENSNSVSADLVQGLREGANYTWNESGTGKEGEAMDTNSFPQNQFPYIHFIEDLQNKHTHLNTDSAESLIRRVDEECIASIDTQLQNFVHINKRIEERAKLRTDVDYYTTKLNKLEEDRDKKTTEELIKRKERERIERNRTKLDGATAKFNAFNQLLTADLYNIYARKESVLGPIAESFATIERDLAQLYVSATVEKHSVEAAKYERRLLDLPTVLQKAHNIVQTDKIMLAAKYGAANTNSSPRNSSQKEEYPLEGHAVIPTVFERAGYKGNTVNTNIDKPLQPSSTTPTSSPQKLSTGTGNSVSCASLPTVSTAEQPLQRAGYAADLVDRDPHSPAHILNEIIRSNSNISSHARGDSISSTSSNNSFQDMKSLDSSKSSNKTNPFDYIEHKLEHEKATASLSKPEEKKDDSEMKVASSVPTGYDQLPEELEMKKEEEPLLKATNTSSTTSSDNINDPSDNGSMSKLKSLGEDEKKQTVPNSAIAQ